MLAMVVVAGGEWVLLGMYEYEWRHYASISESIECLTYGGWKLRALTRMGIN